MKPNAKSVTIATVCFNAAASIEKTILSVLEQTYADMEYIVIDGGSSDGTCDIIQKYRDRIDYFVSEPDCGVYDAMNKAASVAKGEWILFMNSGDTFYSPDSISDVFRNEISAETGVLYGDTIFANGDIRTLKRHGDEKIHSVMPSCHQSIFCRTRLLRENPFDLKYRYAADYDFFYRLKCLGVQNQFTETIVAVYDDSCGLSKQDRYKVKKEMLRCSNSLPLFVVKYGFYRLKRTIAGLIKNE